MSFAPSALIQLDSACELFSKAARGFRAQAVLEIMVTLQKKAHLSLHEFRRGNVSPLSRQISSQSEPGSPFGEDDELSTLGGKTRLVDKKDSLSPHSSPSIIDHSPTSLHPVVPLPLASGNNYVHPYIVDYLNTFKHTSRPPNTGSTYIDASTVGMSPIQGSQYESSRYYQEAQGQPMELVSAQFPPYFSVYDYGTDTDNSFGQMTTSAPRRESPESNMMQNTWQDFVQASCSSLNGREGL
jgi:hypothetical protein